MTSSLVRGMASLSLTPGHVAIPAATSKVESLAPPPMQLRDYQIEAMEAVLNAIDRGVRRPAFVMATGGGKTVVFSHLIPELPRVNPKRGNKVLVLAHKEELIKQAVATITKVNPHLKVEIDMRHMHATFDSDVVVGSVPTLIRVARLHRYQPLDFKAIILDECHHATAGSWTKILKYFEADTPQSEVVVVGCTATLERADGASLGNVFDEVVFERDLITMVQNGELADAKFISIDVDIDLDNLPTKANDYEINSLSALMNNEDTNLLVAVSYKKLQKLHGFKSTLMFCVDVAHCKTLCGVLQQEGINAQYVTGDTVKHERQSIIDDFKNGKIDVLCNVLVFTEGTDIPNIDSIFLVRPTKSRPLLVQMVGRGLRLHGDKKFCYVVDVASTRGTGVISVPTLFSLLAEEKHHGKSFDKEAEKEADDLAEKERLRAMAERDTHERLMALSRLEDDFKLNFMTIDGLLALESNDMQEFSNNKKAIDLFAADPLTWIRMDYDSWVHRGRHQDKFFLIERTRESDDSHRFTLYQGAFTSKAQLIASHFKSKKFLTPKKLDESYNLQTVLAKASTLQKDVLGHDWPGAGSGLITVSQKSYLMDKLKTLVKKHYGEDPKYRDQLREVISNKSKEWASNMIFATRYSVTALHAKWELQKLLGPSKQTRKVLKKVVKSYESSEGDIPGFEDLDQEQKLKMVLGSGSPDV